MKHSERVSINAPRGSEAPVLYNYLHGLPLEKVTLCANLFYLTSRSRYDADEMTGKCPNLGPLFLGSEHYPLIHDYTGSWLCREKYCC